MKYFNYLFPKPKEKVSKYELKVEIIGNVAYTSAFLYVTPEFIELIEEFLKSHELSLLFCVAIICYPIGLFRSLYGINLCYKYFNIIRNSKGIK